MTKAKKKRSVVRILAIVLAVLMPVLTTVTAFAEPGAGTGSGTALSGQKKYESPDINAITGHGEEPEEISVSAGATYLEKAWYEYVIYSDHAVASYRLDDNSRLLFYDPYTYTNSMVMDVQFDAATTEFDTMSSYQVQYTTSKTIDACVSSTDTNTVATMSSGKDITHTEVTNGGYTKTTYNHSIENKTSGKATTDTTYNYKEYRYDTSSEQDSSSTSGGGSSKNVLSAIQGVGSLLSGNIIGGIMGITNGLTVEAEHTEGHSTTVNHNAQIVQDKVTNTTTYSPDYKTSTDYVGTDKVEDNTNSVTDGWTQLSDRVTKTIGSSSSTSRSWSETESTTVSKVYAATHFASDGVTPLPWAIVHYSVQMPMKCCLQVKYSGEWITLTTIYCLLTTVQGTCRAWMENGQVYYEDWGSGEKVVATDFWGQFMTKDQLMQAYQDKLYPTGGAES